MNHPASLSRKLARFLIRCTRWLLPTAQAEWAVAMESELDSLENDFRVIGWAFGCLAVGTKERVRAMVIGDLRISNWVLGLEMALCFVPLTLGWLGVLFGVSGVVRLNMEVIQQYFIGSPSGITVLVTMFSGAILGVLGPIGLLVAFRLIALGRGIRSRLLGSVLVVGPILLGVVYVGGHLIIGGSKVLMAWAGGMLLFFILPVVSAAHMLNLGRPNPRLRPAT